MGAPDQDLAAELQGVAFESRQLQPVRLKFQLGEWMLGAWYPRLWLMDPVDFEQVNWPPRPEWVQGLLVGDAQGLLCRKVSAEFCQAGLGKHGRWLRYVPHADVLHYVSLEGSFADYIKRFSPKSRQNLQRAVRRFSERQAGRPVWEVYTEADSMAQFHAEALAISAQTYQTKLLDAGLSQGPEFLAWLQALAREGRARGYLLRDEGRAVAFAWCRQQGQRLIYDTVGYLPEAAAHSPGSVLLYLLIEDLFAQQRYSLLDFGPGEAQYKSMFATHRQEFVDLYLFRPGLKARMMLTLHQCVSATSTALGLWLERWGVKKRVKAWVRRLKG